MDSLLYNGRIDDTDEDAILDRESVDTDERCGCFKLSNISKRLADLEVEGAADVLLLSRDRALGL